MPRVALLIILAFGLLGLSYAGSLPVFEGTDEAEHFLYSHYLLENGALPRVQSRAEIAAGDAPPAQQWNNESHHPPLYYALGALAIAWTERGDVNDRLRPNDLVFIRGTNANNPNKWLHPPGTPSGDTHLAVYTLRLLNVAIGALTLAVIYLAALEVTSSRPVALVAVLLVAALPTFIVVSSSVTNDPLLTLIYSAGVYLVLRLWNRDAIPWGQTLALALVLAAAALTKLTGLTLFGVVYAALLYRVWRGALPWRDVLRTLVVTAGAALLLAGWWYLRNWTLYGDPFALSVTRTVWGREFEVAATSGDLGAELVRIGRSFWMMIGYLHQPVYGPPWFYAYAGVITLLGAVGLAVRLWRSPNQPRLWLLVGVCALVTLALFAGTRSIDISYGRLLFPALAAFAPLLALGWWTLLRRWSALLPLPLALMALLIPLRVLPTAYPPLTPVEAPPEDVTPVSVCADALEVTALHLDDGGLHPGETLHFDLYQRGSHPQNPALLVTAVDSVSLERLGHTEIYPGMAPTDALPAGTLYRAPVSVPLEQVTAPDRPRQIGLQLRWYSPSAERELDNRCDDGLIMTPHVLRDPRYDPPEADHAADVVFGEAVQLEGYTLEADALEAGAALPIDLHWRTRAALPGDYRLTVQLLDAEGQLVMQADGPITGYPSSLWAADTRFIEQRTLALPPETPPGAYTLHVGWYHPADLARLPAEGPNTAHNLFVVPMPVVVDG